VQLEVQVSPLYKLDSCVDLQTVNISLRVMFKPDEKKLFTIYRNLGLDYDGRVLPSVVHEILKSVVARYTVAQLAHQREQVSAQIRVRLTERLREFMIELDDVAITELSFSP
jgi:regulator of protease activity HflC (stomatin/prohibitin superfamily)